MGEPNPNKWYIGDGVYAEPSEYMIRLTTERHGPDGLGPAVTHEIYLEPGVFESLVEYVNKVMDWGATWKRVDEPQKEEL